jgi:hypothetical protein
MLTEEQVKKITVKVHKARTFHYLFVVYKVDSKKPDLERLLLTFVSIPAVSDTRYELAKQ